MVLRDYAQTRLRALISLADRLGESEFPYQDSREALRLLRVHFETHLQRLARFDEQSDPLVVKQECAISLVLLFQYLPLLGFLLRSTNVRNSFEAFRPLKRLAGKLLPRNGAPDDGIRLLLSSEWDYSPFTYHAIPALKGFVLIGFPASESSNPLLIPLAGHELGHCLWSRSRLEEQFRALTIPRIVQAIERDWTRFDAIFHPQFEKHELTTNLLALEAWYEAVNWCVRQACETFCDLVGLLIFGPSFLHAFAYILSPSLTRRSVDYPSLRSRVSTLVTYSAKESIDCPSEYADLFQEENPPQLTRGDAFRLQLADSVLVSLLDTLHDSALRGVETLGASKFRPVESSAELALQTNEEERILDSFRRVVPAENASGLVALLNAAWRASHSKDLWGGQPTLLARKNEVLQELVLKNLEILDFEFITSEPE